MPKRYTFVGELLHAARAAGLRFIPEPDAPERPSPPPREPAPGSHPPAEPIVPRSRVEGGHYIGLGGTEFPTEVVGESFHQADLRQLRNKLLKKQDASGGLIFAALLKPEPENPVDPDAVAVWSEDAKQLGYLSADDAAEIVDYLNQLQRRGRTAYCEAALYGGTREKPSIGVWLSMVPPMEADGHYDT